MSEYICDACGVDLEVADGTTKEQVRIKPCITCNEESSDHGYQMGYEASEEKHTEQCDVSDD